MHRTESSARQRRHSLLFLLLCTAVCCPHCCSAKQAVSAVDTIVLCLPSLTLIIALCVLFALKAIGLKVNGQLYPYAQAERAGRSNAAVFLDLLRSGDKDAGQKIKSLKLRSERHQSLHQSVR